MASPSSPTSRKFIQRASRRRVRHGKAGGGEDLANAGDMRGDISPHEIPPRQPRARRGAAAPGRRTGAPERARRESAESGDAQLRSSRSQWLLPTAGCAPSPGPPAPPPADLSCAAMVEYCFRCLSDAPGTMRWDSADWLVLLTREGEYLGIVCVGCIADEDLALIDAEELYDAPELRGDALTGSWRMARFRSGTAVSSRDSRCGRRASPAPVAQWIERSPPEREVASSNLAGRVPEAAANSDPPDGLRVLPTSPTPPGRGRRQRGRGPNRAPTG